MTDHTLYDWFARSVRRHPDEPALEAGHLTLTYQELHGRAQVIAERMVRAHGARPERIGLLAARGVVAFAGYLAALRLGATVCPLNPGYPAGRNRAACEAAGVDLLLVDENMTGLGELSGGVGTVLQMSDSDVDEARPSSGSGTLPATGAHLDDIAYILFTSGSTGRPKGVPIRHRNVSPYVRHNLARYRIGPGCRVSHTFDLTFDPSVFDLFVTWAGGATLVVPQHTELLSPVDYLVDRQITHWFSVPSVISVSADLGTLTTERVSTLRHSAFIGEQFTFGQAEAWHAVAPGSVIDNVYGPTELTVACAEYRLPTNPRDWPVTSNDTVPIGAVYDFLDFLVLDEDGHPGEEGELCVRGSQRFDGYLDPADNPGRFLSHDGRVATRYDGTAALTDAHYYRTGDRVRYESGQVVHLGRLDTQVKVRGYRIELGEIESVLRQHPQVRQAIVLSVRHDHETELVGCYTGSPVPPNDLVRWLRRKLPIHMVPRRFLHLDSVPLNANGKVDRGRLHDLLAAANL